MANIREQVIKRFVVELTESELNVLRKVLQGVELDVDESRIHDELEDTFNGFNSSS